MAKHVSPTTQRSFWFALNRSSKPMADTKQLLFPSEYQPPGDIIPATPGNMPIVTVRLMTWRELAELSRAHRTPRDTTRTYRCDTCRNKPAHYLVRARRSRVTITLFQCRNCKFNWVAQSVSFFNDLPEHCS